MKKTYRKFLIISTILIIAGVVFSYVSNKINPQDGSNLVASVGSLGSSTTSAPVTVDKNENSEVTSDVSFLETLKSLESIKIDKSLFENKSFNLLENNSVRIDSVTPGRVNPFAPINSNRTVNLVSTPKVVTNPATQITEKTASLNGTLNVTNGISDIYFEYGPTEQLGNTTITLKKSMVDTFIKNVSGLNPKTNYFFRACAKINRAASCGEIVSFSTN